jgi:putative flippase GtrA
VLFILVTIFGLWVIQPIVILGVTAALSSFNLNESAVLFIAKLIATLASLVWNYLFYSRLVFKKEAELEK